MDFFVANKGMGSSQKRYTTVEQMYDDIFDYFNECKGREMLDQDGDVVLNRDGEPVMVGKEHPTLSGLAFSLGMTRETLYKYHKDDEFKELLDYAKTYIENYTEQKLFDRNTARGAEFSLSNNFGWSQKQDQNVNHTGLTMIDLPPMDAPKELITQEVNTVTYEELQGLAEQLKESLDD